MTESMIEKLARAVQTYTWECVCSGNPMSGARKYHVYEGEGDWRNTTIALFDTDDGAREYTHMMNARAVLLALREPDQAMLDEAWHCTPVCWHSMIDHILKESEPNRSDPT
jgi:hypothetical protein